MSTSDRKDAYTKTVFERFNSVPATEMFRDEPKKGTWESFAETDALLAQLRGDRAGVINAVKGMSVNELSSFGQALWELGNTLGIVATHKARDLPIPGADS